MVQPDKMVDTVLALTGTTWMACKTLKSGHITIFDTKDANMKNCQLEISSFTFLQWAISYDAYLSLGWEPGNQVENYLNQHFSYIYGVFVSEKKIIACGDNCGGIWLYNLENLQLVSDCSSVVNPTSILKWPTLKDPEVEKEWKLKIGTYVILVSQVALNGKYLAAATRSNLICIWGEADSDQMDVE